MPYLGACEICLYVGNVVRDHDHSTGFIRGWLCNRCNRCLGVLENRHRFAGTYPRDVPKKLFKWWRWQFREEIERHLAKSTGIVYEGENRPKSLPSRERDLRSLGVRKPPPARRSENRPKPAEVAKKRAQPGRNVESEATLADYRRRSKLWKHPARIERQKR